MKLRCKLADIRPGEPKQLSIEGRAPIAIYRVNDDYFATDDTCSHGEASLCDGLLDGFIIECPYHAGTFDVRTGKALTFPATQDLKTYPLRFEGPDLILEID